MATKEKKSTKGKKEKKAKKKGQLRGARQAESAGRRIERLQEKFPIKGNEKEWIKFVHGLRAQVAILDRDIKIETGELIPGKPKISAEDEGEEDVDVEEEEEEKGSKKSSKKKKKAVTVDIDDDDDVNEDE